LGADRAILVESDSIVEPLVISKALAKICEDENPNLIILGKQAIDGDNNQTGQMLSALMGYSQATNASEVNLSDDSAEVTREIDGGLQTIKISLPAIVTTDLRLNEPRYASLPNIMKAKKKELNVVSLSEMGFDTSARTELLSVELPAQRAAGIIVESVDDLMDKLKNEAKVIS
jgi:electron transfer flavoprotein beta subunit